MIFRRGEEMKCIRCGSMAINLLHHGRDNADLDLCDVCYWRKRADKSLGRVGSWIPEDIEDYAFSCSECSIRWHFTEGGPKDNDAYFCPRCGVRLIEEVLK